MKNYGARTARIRRKYGADAFRRWGKKGGSPILEAYKEGRVHIRRRKDKKSKR